MAAGTDFDRTLLPFGLPSRPAVWHRTPLPYPPPRRLRQYQHLTPQNPTPVMVRLMGPDRDDAYTREEVISILRRMVDRMVES